MWDEDDIESRPVWDENLATELIGKLFLVGLTHCNSDGRGLRFHCSKRLREGMCLSFSDMTGA